MNWRKRKPRDMAEDLQARWPSLPSKVAAAGSRFSITFALGILRTLFERRGDLSVGALKLAEELAKHAPTEYDLAAYNADGATWATWATEHKLDPWLPAAILLRDLTPEENAAAQRYVAEAEKGVTG